AIDSGYYYAKGYKGWNLLKMGRIKQAIPYCQYSWNYDSFVPWTNINYAHALILKGDKNEAKRLYRKSFEYMTVESDFKEGLLTDFDYFISTGLNETEFKELREEFNNYYLRSWKNRIVGDSLKARSLTYEGKEKYDEGIRLMVAATKEYFKDPKPNWEKVRTTYRWTGYMHYKKKDYSNSVVYYKKAAGVSIAAGLGDDNLISDYDDVANIYDWLDDTLHEMEFRSRASSLEVALREKRDQKRLYMLCIGPNTANKNDSFSQADASVLSTAMKTGADLHFDSVTNHTFLGKNATLANIKNALDSAIYTLGENDVFMFYFSGYGQTGATEGIQLSDGLLPMRDLSGYLSQVPAGRQIHIADCNGLNWREWYQRGNFSQLSSEKRSLMFFGLKNARIEERILNHSVLSNALIKSLETSLEDGVATATEWFSHAAATMFDNDQLYALEMQAFGHDFTIGKAKVALKVKDTFPPLIELFGAVATRGENISLVSNKSVIAGRITDNNNITFASANGITLTIAQNGRFELPKELIGVRNISIVAVDEFGNRNQKDFLVTQSETAKTSESTRYAYLFASKDYEFWDDLTNPIFDAEKIGELLESNYGFQTTIIRNPDRYKITEKLDEIRRFKYKSNDQVFVFFAGHGLYDSVWGGYYVCPESKKPAQDKYYETYYPQQKIADLLDGCNAGNVFLVMDVCFGGKMFDKVDKHEYRSVNDGNELSSDEYVRRQLEIRCRQFLTSGGNNYVEDGVAGTHSPFASRVIYALEEAATKKDYLSASEMMDYLRTMKTMGNDKKSVPRYGFFGGDKDGEFVFKVTRKIRNSATIAGL
ncbi:MAG: caspase family protein, partial [Bacteroidia bacterium]|nr:caspase family protein [Bacteroidia bacterium]